MTLLNWRVKFGARKAKFASSFSLILLVACSFGQDYAGLAKKLDGVRTVAEADQLATQWRVSQNPGPEFKQDLDRLHEANNENEERQQRTVKDFQARLLLRSILLEGGAEKPVEKAASQAAAIKRSPLYFEPDEKDSANWLVGIMERLKNLLQFKEKIDEPEIPNLGLPLFLSQFLYALVFIVLGALALFLLYFVIRHIQWKKRQKRVSSALLDDDEPERSLDEWLELAEKLIAEGRYREAIRALYLSCLLKFDEKQVARFDRGETNWEHLRRIQNSGRRPQDLDFLPPTQAFDRIWYGHHVHGLEDIETFKGWYRQISAALQEVRA